MADHRHSKCLEPCHVIVHVLDDQKVGFAPRGFEEGFHEGFVPFW